MNSNFVTAISFEKRMTQKGEMVHVTVVINDMIYLKGQIKHGTTKTWVEFANAPWKNKEGKWNNQYLAGFLIKDFKDSLDAMVMAQFQKGTDYVNQSMCANYNATIGKRKQAPQQFGQQPQQMPQQQFAPQQPQQQMTPQNFNQNTAPNSGGWMQ